MSKDPPPPGTLEEGTLESPKSCWRQMSTVWVSWCQGTKERLEREKGTKWNPSFFSSFGAKCWPIGFSNTHPLSHFPVRVMVCSPEMHFIFGCRLDEMDCRKHSVKVPRSPIFSQLEKGWERIHGLPCLSSDTTAFFLKANSFKTTGEAELSSHLAMGEHDYLLK